MNLKKLSLAKTEKRKIIFLYLAVLFLLNVCVNSFMRIKLLYLDDLITWNEFSKMSDLQMVFNTSANKFRPVYYFVLNLCYKLFLPRVYLFGIFNLMLNFLVVMLIFYIIKKITDQEFIAFFGSIIYIVSRFAYYAISQVHGIMEQMGMIFALLTLLSLWNYIEQNNKKYFYFACVFQVLVFFVHERFMSLFPLFLLAVILVENSTKLDRIMNLIVSTLSFIVPFCSRLLFLKDRAFDGTGGTDIKETFNLTVFLSHFKSGILYLLGRNAGPAYLNGIEQSNVLSWIKFLNMIFVFIIFLVVALYLYFIFKNRKKTAEIKKQLKLSFFVSAFIFLTLISACATIRLEMRWIYTPYVGFIILISNMISYIKAYLKGPFCMAIMISILCIIIPTELYFRSNYKNIYYWETYQIYNSVFDQTLKRYKDELWNKKLIIISKNSDFFGENAEMLKTSFNMIKQDNSMDVKVYRNIKDVSASDFNNDSNIILGLDNYNKKMVNLKDIEI